MSKQPEKGKLLIAEPFMPDDNFKRTVILLCGHDKQDGAFGFVLNRKSTHKLGDAIPELETFEADLFYGGPVEQNTLHYIHTYGNQLNNSVSLGNGMYWGGDFDQLFTLINTKQLDTQHIRFFLGYSGWGVDQLAEEMESNSWIIADCLPEYVFTEKADTVWRRVLTDMGGEYKVIANFPENPTLN